MKMKSFGDVNGEMIFGLPMVAILSAGVTIILKEKFKIHVLNHERDNSGTLITLQVSIDQSHFLCELICHQ